MLLGRISAKWLLAAAAGLWALSMLPMAWSTSFGVLIASRVVLGFAEGPASAMAMPTAHSWFPPEKRAVPTTLITAGASCGPLLAAPILTEVIIRYTWHAAFALPPRRPVMPVPSWSSGWW